MSRRNDATVRVLDRRPTLAIDPIDLWSIAEGRAAYAAIVAIPDELDDDEYERAWHAVLAREAKTLLTKWHRRRLWLLVRRLEAELPIAGSRAPRSPSRAAARRSLVTEVSVRTSQRSCSRTHSSRPSFSTLGSPPDATVHPHPCLRGSRLRVRRRAHPHRPGDARVRTPVRRLRNEFRPGR